MKNILTIATITVFGFTNAQFTIEKRLDEKINYVHNTVSAREGGIQIPYADIVGTPYPDKNFKEAKIAESYKNEMVRYNAFRDDIEYKDGDDIMLLPKEDRFNRIQIIPNKEVLVYLNLDEELGNVYFYELVRGKISLYKKKVIGFSDMKKAESSFKTDEPAAFFESPSLYYIKIDNRVMKNPKKEKDFIAFFPEYKVELENYLKQNKTKLNREEDLIKVVNFLNK